MKTYPTHLWAALTAVLLSTLAARVSADDVSWFTIDGGGGASSGGQYAVSGTIGQPDAGAMNGGSYSLVGGFWGVAVAIQVEGAPLLHVTRLGSSMVVDWPFPSAGFTLQQTTALNSPSSAIVWTDVLSPAAVHVGADWTVTIPSPAGKRFFRLRKP